jgi:hypothetical protein
MDFKKYYAHLFLIIKNIKSMTTNFLTKTMTGIFLLVIFLSIGQEIFAQALPTTQVLPDTSKMTYNQISQSMKLFAYPSKGQSQQQQKEDEFECYKWAVDQSGIDPLDLPKVEAAPTQTGPTGGAIVGGARGAAAGAAIGAIAGDAGKGAAIGAVVGGLGGRRAGREMQAHQNQQSQANAAASEQAMKDSFEKAFTVCMEGKGYTIK